MYEIAAEVLAARIGASVAPLELGGPSAPAAAVVGTPGTTSHAYQVVAVSRGGFTSAPSGTTTIVTAPDAPDEDNFVRVTWAPVADAGGYLVFRDADGAIARVAPGEALSVDDIALTGDGQALPVGVARVEVGQADPEGEQDYPSATVIPNSLEFEPELGYEEVDDPSLDAGGRVVWCVGEWTGTFEIRVSAKDKPQRQALQDAIHAMFFTQVGRRGVIVAPSPQLVLNGVITTVVTPIAFALNTSEWREEYAFGKRRWVFVDVDVEFQALVVMDGIYTIEELQLVLRNDVDVTRAEDTVDVDQTGSITPL